MPSEWRVRAQQSRERFGLFCGGNWRPAAFRAHASDSHRPCEAGTADRRGYRCALTAGPRQRRDWRAHIRATCVPNASVTPARGGLWRALSSFPTGFRCPRSGDRGLAVWPSHWRTRCGPARCGSAGAAGARPRADTEPRMQRADGITYATIDLSEAEYRVVLCQLRQRRVVAAVAFPARPGRLPARGLRGLSHGQPALRRGAARRCCAPTI